MPFIDSKITVPVTSELKEEIKSELGKLITTLGKTETYLMVGIEDAYDLWLGGKKLDKGAYVSVSLYGNAPAESYDKLMSCTLPLSLLVSLALMSLFESNITLFPESS